MASSENSRIVKNSITLFIRMLFTMWLNLYATRIVLEQLGADDYGVYGVVGSVVSMFSVLSAGLIKATQRFITYEIGRKDGHPKEMFGSILNVTFLFAIVIFLVLEIAGLWFLQNHMKVPEESRNAAFWVYQFSVLTTLVSLISTPYNALIIAHEKLNVFAYITIIQVVFNFLAAMSLKFIPGQHLFWYGFFLMLITITIRIIYQIYCKKNFPESAYTFRVDVKMLKEVGRFTGWATLDGGLNTLVWNGVVWIFNICFGPAVNAAYAIAGQVNNAIHGFAQNIQKSIDPQVTKTYASGDYKRHCQLIYIGSKVQVIVIYLIIIPFIVRARYILTLWLGNVPEYAVQFCRLSVLMGLVISFSELARTSIVATGRIRRYVVIPNVTHLLLLPLCIIVNRFFNAPILMMVVIVVMYVLIYALRLYLAAKGSVFSLRDLIKEAIAPGLSVGVVSMAVLYLISRYIPNTFVGLVIVLIISSIIIVISAWVLALSKVEKQWVSTKIKSLYCRYRRR